MYVADLVCGVNSWEGALEALHFLAAAVALEVSTQKVILAVLDRC